MSQCVNPACIANYNFDHIAQFAIKRFVEGSSTLSLLQQAKTEREKQEIAVVSLLDVEANTAKNLRLSCQHKNQCEALDCRDRLKRLIDENLKQRCG